MTLQCPAPPPPQSDKARRQLSTMLSLGIILLKCLYEEMATTFTVKFKEFQLKSYFTNDVRLTVRSVTRVRNKKVSKGSKVCPKEAKVVFTYLQSDVFETSLFWHVLKF